MTRERTIHLVGAGGVGFWTAVGLARFAVGNVIVYDDDTLEGGLGHMRLPMAMPATRKVDLLVGFIRISVGGQVPTVVAKRFTGRTEVRKGDLVVDCSDAELPARRRMWNAARKAGARCIRISYDGANGIIVVAEGLPFATISAGGYTNVPSFALSLAAGGIGAEIVHRMLEGNHRGHIEFQITLSELAGMEVRAAA